MPEPICFECQENESITDCDYCDMPICDNCLHEHHPAWYGGDDVKEGKEQ